MGTSKLSMAADNYESIPALVPGKRRVHTVIETPAFTRHKYAYDSKFRIMKLKTTLPEGLEWPYDYGFVPGTRAEDGDPLDVLVLNDTPTFTGCLIEARVLGIFCLTKNGVRNDRLIARAPRCDGVALTTDRYKTIEDVPEETIRGIERFLVEYSEEAGNTIKVQGCKSRPDAFDAVDKAIAAFKKAH